MENVRKNLINPPIKEVIIGISFEELFKTPEDINDFYQKSFLKDKYPKIDEIRTISFEIGNEPKLGKNLSIGSIITSEDDSELLHIEFNKLMFVDKNKYTDFDNFINKFTSIISEVLKLKSEIIPASDIGLRYINKFKLPLNKLNEFHIVPTFTCYEQNEVYAQYINHLTMTNIRSAENENIFANVKTILGNANGINIDITFDIDVHLKMMYNINNVENFYNEILQLKNFKNKIFFSNFDDAYKVKEFQ